MSVAAAGRGEDSSRRCRYRTGGRQARRVRRGSPRVSLPPAQRPGRRVAVRLLLPGLHGLQRADVVAGPPHSRPRPRRGRAGGVADAVGRPPRAADGQARAARGVLPQLHALLVTLIAVAAAYDGGADSPLATALVLPVIFAALSYPVGSMVVVGAMTLLSYL